MAKLSEFQSAQNSDENKIREKFDTFKNMSKEQLNEQLLKEVSRQKGEGVFDYEKLSAMVENLKGFLPANEYENVKRILESLR